MARIRDDAVAGVLSVGLTNAATSMDSAALADLRVIAAPDIAAITIYVRDTDGRVVTYEIVHVTAHTAGATSATIVRGQEGTNASAWSSGIRWSHGPTEFDWNEKVTSDSVDDILTRTQAQYDAIVTKDPETLYIIVG